MSNKFDHILIARATPIPINKESICWKIFLSRVHGSTFCINDEQLRQCCIVDLDIQPQATCQGFYIHVPQLLRHFIKVWPGWSLKKDYLTMKVQQGQYFQSFKWFLHEKMQAAVDLFPRLISDIVDNLNVDSFTISINCPANMLNTMAFTHDGNDIVLEQYHGLPWCDLTDSQLLNWPHITVIFKNDDICLIRKLVIEYERYLNFSNVDAFDQKDPKTIESVDYNGATQCYSTNYLEKYFATYIEALQTVPEIVPEKLAEIETILTHFLEDIRVIDINSSIPRNSNVLFRLSDQYFTRNKKLVRRSPKLEIDQVEYCEIIIPKVQLQLLDFKAKQVETDELRFEYTDKIKDSQKHMTSVMPNITYICQFCNITCQGENTKQQILQHIKNNHTMEEPVRCSTCKQQFEFSSLAAARWNHTCNNKISI